MLLVLIFVLVTKINIHCTVYSLLLCSLFPLKADMVSRSYGEWELKGKNAWRYAYKYEGDTNSFSSVRARLRSL